jgi:hypothetical protein
MIFKVEHQESYSRGELLLRSIFGIFYIALPHGFILFFLAIWSQILQFLSFWIIVFTGRYPQSFYEYQIKYLQWTWRVNARLLNLADGYPAFGLDATDEATEYYIPYKESSDRFSVFLRGIFGFIYVLIPHGIVLYFLIIVSALISFLAWWIVLFTGRYPRDMFNFVLNVQRWGARLGAYLMYLTDIYPPFSLQPDMRPYEEEFGESFSGSEEEIASEYNSNTDRADENDEDTDQKGKQPDKDEFV